MLKYSSGEIDAAVETYNKTGLFAEMDKKYELPPGMQAALPGGGEDKGAPGGGSPGGGGFNFGGGIEGTPGIDSEAGGGTEGTPAVGPSAGAPAGGGGPENAGAPAGGGGAAGIPPGTIAEQRTAFRKKMLLESSARIDNMIDELVPDEPVKIQTESDLTKKNKNIGFKTKKLLETMEAALSKMEETGSHTSKSNSVIIEYKRVNSLADSSDKMLEKTNDTLSKLDEILGTMHNKSQEPIIDDVVIEEVVTPLSVEPIDSHSSDEDETIEPVENV